MEGKTEKDKREGKSPEKKKSRRGLPGENERKKKSPKIKSGYRIGELTVAADTGRRKNGSVIWRCQCSCGGFIDLDTRMLKNGAHRDCGCRTKVKPGQRDLTGLRFGKLVCIEPTGEKKYNRPVWLCRCDCGNTVKTTSGQLVSGYVKSCGCLSHPPLKDFVGKRFGSLTVLSYAGKRDGMHRWLCRCDCGSETTVGQTLLQTGKTRSCGCIKKDVVRENLKLSEGTSVAKLEASKRRLIASNRSGHTGVYQNRKNGRWNAQITFKGRTRYLGSYQKIEDAIKARERAEEEIHDKFLEEYYKSQGQG